MPLKKSIPSKKSTHSNKSTRHSNKSPSLKQYIRLTGRISAGTIALAVISVLAAALMLAGHQPYHAEAIARIDTQVSTAAQDGARTAAPQDARTEAQQDGAKTATLKAGTKTAAQQDGAKTAAPQDGAKKAAAMAPAAGAVTGKRPAADATAVSARSAESATKTPEPKSAPVTITGCLERADETFRLKDATGVDAPKSRSWKSGFLKKGSASVEIVDAANELKLPDHVGQRVSVTGTLMDRAMQGRSLQRVAASCTTSARVRI
jgi:cytoskeletal protein RodZ